MKPIYRPKGKAGEYADWALNIYTGCTHGCEYCYAPAVLRKSREAFSNVSARKGIVDAAERQLAGGGFEGETIHLCFTCDPYPSGVDTAPTREIIRLIHEAGAHVQLLTKRPAAAVQDFDLLGAGDMFGVTITGAGRRVEPFADAELTRLRALYTAWKFYGIGTWVSCEPVYDTEKIYRIIEGCDYIDLYKIGKLNYRPSDIDWREFGRRCEELCQRYGRNYLIKESLREIMERTE